MSSSLTELETKLRLGELCSGHMTELEAINILEDFISLGLPIPAILRPYAGIVFKAWRTEKSKANIRSSRKISWEILIFLVRKHILITGCEPEEAFAHIVAEHPDFYYGEGATVDTLKRHYRNPDYATAIDRANQLYSNVQGI